MVIDTIIPATEEDIGVSLVPGKNHRTLFKK